METGGGTDMDGTDNDGTDNDGTDKDGMEKDGVDGSIHVVTVVIGVEEDDIVAQAQTVILIESGVKVTVVVSLGHAIASSVPDPASDAFVGGVRRRW